MTPFDMTQGKHVSVLLNESIDLLDLEEGDIFLDGTLGAGGHSALVAERFHDAVEIIGLDRDPEALKRSEERLRTLTTSAFFRQESFKNLDQVLEALGVGKVNGILLDLGISSDQLDAEGRGFSFLRDEPLSMNMDPNDASVSAELILNTWDEESIELIIRGFGEEKLSRKIAREIVRRREIKPFKTTFDLLEAVGAATPASAKRFKIHPATRTFQALRIAVNGELAALEEGLEKGFEALESNGRMAVISFHSLEDRIVKQFFKEKAENGAARLITKKPITPTDEEIERNPRSRSAKLRVIQKL
ncbi:MAG: Ribosomal small subunit methyltransferase [Parcubacteria group bacterium]|nr:Ribosomal small subunit methyltransferase [Parcubacteria group bacterium]